MPMEPRNYHHAAAELSVYAAKIEAAVAQTRRACTGGAHDEVKTALAAALSAEGVTDILPQVLDELTRQVVEAPDLHG